MKRKIIVPTLMAIWSLGIILMAYIIKLLGTSLQGVSLGNLIHLIVYRGIVILIIVTLATIFILNQIIDKMIYSIGELSKEANLMARGEYTHRIKEYNIEEIDELANNFDIMGEQLHRTIRKLNYQKTKAQSVLSSLEEGIVVLDEEGIIKEVNTFAANLLGIEKIPKCHINELLRYSACVKMMQQVVEKNSYTSCEIIKEDKVLYISVTPMKQEEINLGYVLTLRDMTKTRKLEEMRYQFVNNVTHELKTPLTSIQGFIETLKAGALEDKVIAYRFLDIIDIEAQRLYRLIQDILNLSEIENTACANKGQVNMTDIIYEAIHLLEKEAHKKKIKIIFNEQHNLVMEKVNEDHMKQIIINLLGNAIKYTDTGNILVTTAREGSKKRISVKDTGIGIPRESVERIFERFYRVDKSRSRKSGGTGLGLAIVKHIVNLYNGEIQVESELGKGSLFTIIFK